MPISHETSSKVPVIPKIQKFHFKEFPMFLFEWHEHTQKVYVIGLPGRWEGGEFVLAQVQEGKNIQGMCLAEHCAHHARFYGFVQTFLRGYRQGVADAKAALESKNKVSIPTNQGIPNGH
jgi:hypothetical protein